MRIAGEARLNAPVDRVWEAILDPGVLVRTIPGCERLETTGEHAYAMTVMVGVAAIRGVYTGAFTLTDLHRHESLVLSAQGAGAPGTIGADVNVTFAEDGDGATQVRYDADAVVGGMIGGVGQRMLSSVSRRMVGEFFANIDRVLQGGEASPEVRAAAAAGEDAAGPPVPSPVFTAPARGARATPSEDLVKGAVLGGLLVLAGVVVGAAAARRRP